MKIFYTGNICSDQFFGELVKTQTSPPSFAQLKLERNILKGFEENQVHVSAYGQYPIRNYPGNNKIFLKKTVCRNDEKQVIVNPAMINLLFLKQIYQFFSMFFIFLHWIVKNRGQEKVFFSYSVYPPVTFSCMILVKIFRLKSITYVSEVPALRLFHNQGSLVRKFLLSVLTKSSMFISKKFSNFVFTTEHTNDFFHAEKENYVVIEGISNISLDTLNPKRSSASNQFVVMYAGGVNKQNGMEILIDVWKKLDEDYVLWIFGDGDYSEILQGRISNMENVFFFGNRPHVEIIESEKKASLLINPRFSTNDFTKYSFPSKTIEYLESGTPVISSKLEGIPDEYFRFISELPSEVDEIVEKIKSLADEECYDELLGRSAKGFFFVRDEKNVVFQMRKVVEMMSVRDRERRHA